MLQNIQKWELAPKNITWLTRTGEKQRKVIWCSGRSASSYQISFERSHSIFPCPFSGQLIVLLSVSFVDFSYFWNQWIIGIWITKQGAYRQQNWNKRYNYEKLATVFSICFFFYINSFKTKIFIYDFEAFKFHWIFYL